MDITPKQLIEKTYRGKKVFLTGHTGFKGSWLLTWLYLLEAEVKGYSLAPEGENALYHGIAGDERCNSIFADIRDKERLTQEIESFKPDFIFHLAAQPLVRMSYVRPLSTFETNVLGTANVLDAMRSLDNCCTAVMITTDKVYDNKEWHYPYRETDPLGGYDPYSASKAAAELVINSYRNSFFHPQEYTRHRKAIASARAGNVIGGGDWAAERIVPDIARALNKQEAILVRSPHAVRPWQHVIEPIYGYLLLGAKLLEKPQSFAEAWNFGPLADDTFTVEQLVQQAIQVWGKGNYQVLQSSNQPHEAHLLKLDISKTIEKLGWKPKWSAKTAIENTIKWYKNAETQCPFALIKATIDSY